MVDQDRLITLPESVLTSVRNAVAELGYTPPEWRDDRRISETVAAIDRALAPYLAPQPQPVADAVREVTAQRMQVAKLRARYDALLTIVNLVSTEMGHVDDELRLLAAAGSAEEGQGSAT